jgi:peptide/nickel transport system ATP-binding protein
MVPHPFARPRGCQFSSRCDLMVPGRCDAAEPADVPVGPNRISRCIFADDLAGVLPAGNEVAA